MDVFPPNDLLHKDRDADAPALVDIGGGTGADVLQFRRRYPDVAGQIILQDLPAVINSAKAKNTDLTTLVTLTQTLGEGFSSYPCLHFTGH